MTYLATIAPDAPHVLADEANAEWFQEFMPGWETRERVGIDVLTERDFPVDEDTETVASDWDWFIEDSYVDPAEVA